MKAGAAFLDFLGKIAPLDELGDHEAQPVVGTPHVVNRHDMGMVETGNDAGFLQVSLDILGLRDTRHGRGTLIATGRLRSSSKAR